MKKIIKGKIYDTDTATFLAEYDSGHSVTDFQHYTEELYQKKTGEFFIYGEGGPASRYSQACPTGGWDGGRKIVPLTYEQAREWAEKNLNADEYEEIFGEVVEDDSRMTVTLSLSVGAVERAKRAAAKEGTSLSGYIENLL